MERNTRVLMIANPHEHNSVQPQARDISYQRYQRRPETIWIKKVHAVEQVPRVRPLGRGFWA
jgi:hypothetical protein